MMKKIYILLLPILFLNCKQNVTDSNEIIGEVKVIKTPRQMTWTADTLISPDLRGGQLMMENILVFSTSDVWICGWNDVARGLIWHYDGKKWSESNIAADVGGMRVNDLAGYSSKDLWACGYTGKSIFLAHYNGQHWIKTDDMGIHGELLDMCKDPNGNIWACGRNGVIMKYDKTKWIVDTVKFSFSSPTEYFLKNVEYYGDKVYALASSVNIETLVEKYFYINGDLHKWTVLDSLSFDISPVTMRWGIWGLYSSSYNKLYSYGLAGSWIYDKNKWGKSHGSNATIHGMYGISEDYLIEVGDFQQAYFYDGTGKDRFTDIYNLKDQNFVFTNVWTNGYETFIIGYGNIGGSTGSIIFHGK